MQDFLHGLSAESTAVLLDAAVKGTVILALAAAATLAMRRTSAATRHAVWLLAITGLLALPVLCITLPGLHVLPDWCSLTPESAADAGEAMPLGEAPLIREEPGPSLGVEVVPVGTSGVESSDPRLTETPQSDPAAAPMPTAFEPMEFSNPLPALLPEPAPAEASQANWSVRSILPWLGGLWATGTAVLLVLLLLGQLSLWRLGRSSRPISSSQWTARMETTCAKLSLSRPVMLLESDERPVPMIWGVLRPKLLLPSQAGAWPETRCRAVLLHELGHVKRRDCLSKLLAQLACALYWLNPLVWVASKLMQLEAERACDDLVINSGAAPRDYASHVLEIASGSRTNVFAIYSAIAMARRSRLEGRLLAILDRRRNRRPMTVVGALAAAALVAGVAAVVASVRAAAPDEARADRVATEQPTETSSQPAGIDTALAEAVKPDLPSPAGARVSLVLDREEFLLGENITVCYRLENAGQEPLRYEKGGHFPALRRNDGYVVTMTPVDAAGQPIGKPLEAVPGPEDLGGLAGRWELKPGEVYQQTLYLPRYVRLDRPGRFRLRIVNRGRLFGKLDSPLRKQVFSAGETAITLKVPTPQEAREVYQRMKKLPREPVAGIGERRDQPIADFEALIHPVYLPILREQALWGDRDALLGLGKMWTAQANEAVIDAIDQALGKDDLEMALAAYHQVSGLPDPRDYPGFYPDPKAHETPDTVARRAFVERTWRAEFAETLRRLASRLARDPQMIGLRETAKIYECVGTAADMPDLALAYSKSIERTKTLPMESQYFRPRGSAYTYRFAAWQLLKRGAEVALDPQTPGEAAVYLIAMRHREDFRPSDWPQQLVRWLEHETPYMREMVLEYMPDPVPEAVLRMVPKLMADEYVDLQIAACHTARKHPREAFREPLLEILRNGTEEHLLNAATQAGAANGIGNDQVMEIWLGRMDNSDLGGKAVLRLLLSVLDGDRAGYVDQLDADVQAAAEARWDRFIREHREELRRGRRFKLGDPQITPDLFPRGFQFYFQGKPWPAEADRAEWGPAVEAVLEPNRKQWETAAGESARGPSDLGPLRETDPRLPYYRDLYGMYRLVIKDQIAAGDEGRILQITEEFNKKHDSVLIYAGVARKGTDGKMERLLSKFYGRDPFALPAISYDANVSGTVQVTQFNDYAVIETANPADGTWVRLLVTKDNARRIEALREEHRKAAAAAVERSDRVAATRHYKALLALPDPPLRDCRAACKFFEAQQDWESLAMAQEATAQEMKRVIHTPAEQFTRPAPENPGRREGGPTVLVQTGLDGIWVNCKGTAAGWVNNWVTRRQEDMKWDRLDLLVKLGRLYRDTLSRPKKAVGALAEAMYDVEFFIDPIDKVIARDWPVRSGEHKEIHGPAGGSYVGTLRELSEMQQQAGDLDGAIETKTRELLAGFVLAWNHRDGTVNRCARELWSLVQQLPADAPLPPLFWFNVLSPEEDTITFDLSKPEAQRDVTDVYHPNVVARPGYAFDTLEVTADMESLGGNGVVDCYTVFEKQTSLGEIRWQPDGPGQKGRQRITKKFTIPKGTGLVRFETILSEEHRVHAITVKATFRPEAAEPAEIHPAKSLIAALADDDDRAWTAAVRALVTLGKPAVKELVAALEDKDPRVRRGAVQALGHIKVAGVIDPLIKMLNDPEATVRTDAADGLGYLASHNTLNLRPARLVPALAAAVKDHHHHVRGAAAWALWQANDARAVAPLLGALGDEDPGVQWRAAEGLGYLRAKAAVEPLMSALGSDDKTVRRHAAAALGRIGDRRPLPRLSALAASDEHADVRAAAGEALRIIEHPQPQPSPIAWGEAVDGLQAGLRSTSGMAPYRYGQIVRYELLVRNLGQSERVVQGTRYLAGWLPWVKDGKVLLRGMMVDGDSQLTSKIPAGGTKPIDWIACTVRPSDWKKHDSPPSLRVAPGRYEASTTFVSSQHDPKSEDVWEGKLCTGELPLEVMRPAEPTVETTGAEPEKWGEPVEGVQVRLRPDKPAWALGEVPTLKAEIRNQGTRDLSVAQAQPLCKLEVDGRWHDWVGEIRVRSSWFPPGREYKDIPVSLVSNWHDQQNRKPVKLGAGKHTVRVAFICRPGEVGDSSKAKPGTPVRAVSNPVQIEILPDKAAASGEDTAWGEPVEGVQVRLRADEKTWKIGMLPSFKADVRNQGKQELVVLPAEHGFEVEVDGRWYFCYAPGYDVPNKRVQPGARCEDLVISLGHEWLDKEINKSKRGPERVKRLALAPGRHVVRVAPVLADRDVRAVSNPVQIEIVAPPLLKFGPVWDKTIRDVRSGRDCFIDFDTGRVMGWPSDGLPPFDPERGVTEGLRQFMRSNGLDAIGWLPRNRPMFEGLLGLDMKVVEVADTRWFLEANPTGVRGPLSNVRLLGDTVPISEKSEVPPSERTPKAFLFQTREGAVGKLRLIDGAHVALSYQRVWKPEELQEWSDPGPTLLRLRLRPNAPQWVMGQTPELTLDLWNDNRQDSPLMYVGLQEVECELEYDGQRYRWSDPVVIDAPGRMLKAHRVDMEAIKISLVRSWARTDRPFTGEAEDADRLKLTPGKHTVRVLFAAGYLRDANRQVQVRSKPVEIEIVGGKPAPDAGKALEGPSANNDRVTQLIDQLGDRRYAQREAAERELIRIGEAAWAALKTAQKHEDPEIAVRAKRALAEIGRRIEALRREHRKAAAAAAERSDRVSARRHHKGLLALPDPPLWDCRQAARFFEAQQDWESLATAQEATAQEMKRVIDTPVEQFIRPAPRPEPPAGGRIDTGPVVRVQADLDGIWVNGKGDAEDWIAPLKWKQKLMELDRFSLLQELGRLYRDRLQQPKKAAQAFALALADFDFCTQPIEKLIAQTWPVRSGQHAESIERVPGETFAPTLRELSEMQQAAGDIDAAIETKTRELLAGFVLAWNHRDGTVSRCARELWSLVQRLPADAPLPPLLWFNMLSPQRDTITFDLSKPEAQRDVTDLYHPNVVARPGYAFDTLEVTADMESLGGNGMVRCYAASEMHAGLGLIWWHSDGPAQKGRQRTTKKFKIPKGTELVCFETTLSDEHRVHAITVKATFRPRAGEPAEPAFGPVVERIVSFNFMEDAAHLDLDTGKHGRNQPGRDLIAAAGESDMRVRSGLDMVAIPVDASRWNASPEEILTEAAKAPHQRHVRLGGPESRRTFFFNTREGGVGVLSIVPTSDEQGSVKVRYKMLLGTSKQATWGLAVEGVQVRLRADETTWKTGTLPSFKADVRNEGNRDLYFFQTQTLCELEVDGNWYEWAGPGGEDVKSSPLSPGRQYDGIPVTLVSSWHSKEANRPLEVTIGKHIVRVVFIAHPMEKDGKPLRPVGNPVEIEMVAENDGSTREAPAAPLPDWARAVVRVFPDWEVVRCDRRPSVETHGTKGSRLLLRRGRREYLGQQQHQQPRTESAVDDVNYRTVYSHVDVLVFPSADALPDNAAQAIPWEEVEQEWFAKPVDLGLGLGYRWFARTTIFWQQDLRAKLGLAGGDDRLQLLVDGLTVKDRGDCTANSVILPIAKAGDRAIPYLEAALERTAKEDAWRLPQPLAKIDTQRATDLLVALYGDDKTRDAAAYALISGAPRKRARQIYFDLLRRRQYVYYAGEACVAFGWQDAVPLLQEICDRPTNWDFRSAFDAKRRLEGRPVPESLAEAERVLTNEEPTGSDPAKVDAAKRALLTTPDKEAAAIVAAHLADFNTKLSSLQIEAVRRIGRELLHALPDEVTRPLLEKLIAGFPHPWDRQRLEQALQSLDAGQS